MVANGIEMIGVIFVCVLFPFYSSADQLDEQYIGCYQDNVTDRDLDNGIILQSMTISSCIEHCRNNGKTYAGAQNGEECFCGDIYGKYGPSHECKVNCPGNTSYYCGGYLQNSIYSVCPISRYGTSCNKECHCSKDAPCNLSSGSCLRGCATGWTNETPCNETAVPASELSHYGCFTDARGNGLPTLFEDINMTIQLCMDRCRIIRFGLYIGLQYSTGCFCGNSSYSANGPSQACGVNCPTPQCSCGGSSGDRCGGINANDVYSTCQKGYYGVLCSHQCHCFQGSNCTIEDGTCPGGCSDGWTGKSCNIRNCTDKNGACTGVNEICIYEKTGEGAERVVPRCRCKEGYTRNQEYEDCRDIDECRLTWPSNQCDSNFGECFNLDGTYSCTCKTGFQNNGSQVCEDINECSPTYQDNECINTTGNCTNTLGNYTCNCFDGFKNIDSDKYCIAVSPPDPSDPSDDGVIVGAVVGSLCALLIILALLAFLYWRRRKSEHSSGSRRNSGFSNTYKDSFQMPENVLPTEIADPSNVSSAPSAYEELRRPDESQLHENNYEKLTPTISHTNDE